MQELSKFDFPIRFFFSSKNTSESACLHVIHSTKTSNQRLKGNPKTNIATYGHRLHTGAACAVAGDVLAGAVSITGGRSKVVPYNTICNGILRAY